MEKPIDNMSSFNPSEIASLLEKQFPDEKEVLASLKRRTSGRWSSGRKYIYFVEPTNPNQPNSEWQHVDCIILDDTDCRIVIDVLLDHQVGGIEFLSMSSEEE